MAGQVLLSESLCCTVLRWVFSFLSAAFSGEVLLFWRLKWADTSCFCLSHFLCSRFFKQKSLQTAWALCDQEIHSTVIRLEPRVPAPEAGPRRKPKENLGLKSQFVKKPNWGFNQPICVFFGFCFYRNPTEVGPFASGSLELGCLLSCGGGLQRMGRFDPSDLLASAEDLESTVQEIVAQINRFFIHFLFVSFSKKPSFVPCFSGFFPLN